MPKKDLTLNHDFFKIWTPESAYLIGLIAADGNLFAIENDKYHNYSISLKSIDIELIKCFIKLLNTSNKICIIPACQQEIFGKLVNCKEKYLISINSKIIFNDLNQIGLFPNKSLTLNWISKCPENLYSHLIRGYFDGDGWSCINPKTKKPTIGFIGSEKFLTNLNQILVNKLDIKYKKLSLVGKVYTLVYHAILDNQKIINYIYNDSYDLIRLNRKYKKCLSQLNIVKYQAQGSVEKKYNKWISRINNKWLGSFDTWEEANNARIEYLKTGTIKQRITQCKEAFGELKTLPEWAKDSRCHVNIDTLRRRLKQGYLLEHCMLSTKDFKEKQNEIIRKSE
jgi:hypothetical protein